MNHENDSSSIFDDEKFEVDYDSEDEEIDEYQIMLAEAQLLTQRNTHFCDESLLKRFRRLIRVDFPELLFSPLIQL